MPRHIDTLDVQLALDPRVNDLIKDKLQLSSNETGVYKLSPAYLPAAFRYQCRGYYLIVKLSHQFMIGIETVEELQEKVLQLVTDFFHITTDDIVKYKVVKTPTSKIRIRCKSGKEITRKLGSKLLQDLVEINRCEYKNDYRLKSTDEKFAAMDIFRIVAEKRRRTIKGQYKYTNRTNCTYSNENNNYVSITSYFKEYERLEKENIAGAEKYKNILRTEVKLKNKHLNDMKKTRDKTLAQYFKEEVAQEYFQKYLEPIFYTDPYFYRLDIAKDIIQNYQPEEKQDDKKQEENQEDNQKVKQEEQLQIPQFKKNRLCKFLTEINELGITPVKEKYCDETFKDYSKIIRKLGISILCFSPIINGTVIKIEKMENFTLFQNSIDTDI